MNSLESFFTENPKCALAFSGGTDSAFLLGCAARFQADVKAYFIKTSFQPAFELQDAKKLADALEIPLEVLEFDILSIPEAAANPPDRCYHCKRALFSLLWDKAHEDGYPMVIDGTNASDNFDDRPGMRAIRELGVRSPLKECGITKKEVRELSKNMGLFTWDKPSYSCLATRVPQGTRLTKELLNKIEAGENMLFSLGFSDFRLRADGKSLTLEVPQTQHPLIWQKTEEIEEELSYLFPGASLTTKGREPSL